MTSRVGCRRIPSISPKPIVPIERTKRTGLEYRAAVDGQRVAGTYRRSVMLASGRFAMLDDGVGFSLVPWRPVIAPRLGQALSAVVRGADVSWTLGRQRGPVVG
ncbi:uncharacterized protein DUF3363 [Fulvimonas soli]|jgi:hypothetical protein|uniref:Uncharacterized protein DUF3363 n=1 Tax=Fulvimonas soli TaxID=155197 RepID=A0A316I1F2_9GAMM|nr:uncharacterized protein DUF3363 [Fulvimonas soli]